METLSHEALAALRGRLHDYMLGHARMDAARMVSLDVRSWAVAAQLEQLRRFPLVGVLDDELLAAIASRAIEPGIEARYLARRLRGVEAEVASESAASSATPVDLGLPPTAIDQMEATVRLIARARLGFETLQERQRDSLDFRSCGVANVRDALVEAYVEGWHASAWIRPLRGPCRAGW